VRILEVLVVISIGAARWILLQAIDDRLRNGRLICGQVRGKVGIGHVKEHEIYEIDPGGAHATRVLVPASRRNGLFLPHMNRVPGRNRSRLSPL
jgi:hypothetical protein